MSTRVKFKKMIPFAGFVATSATSATIACYGVDRTFEHMSMTKPRSRLTYSMDIIESTAFIMFYRHFKPSWRIICAASVYPICTTFCRRLCTDIFDACKEEWDKIKMEDETGSNAEAQDQKSLDSEDGFGEDTTS